MRQYEAKATIFEPNFPQSTPYESYGSDTFRLVQIYRNHLSCKGKKSFGFQFPAKKTSPKTNPKKLRFAQQVPDFLPLLRDFRRHRLDSRLWAAADLHLGEHEPREQKHARLLLQLFVQPMLALEHDYPLVIQRSY